MIIILINLEYAKHRSVSLFEIQHWSVTGDNITFPDKTMSWEKDHAACDEGIVLYILGELKLPVCEESNEMYRSIADIEVDQVSSIVFIFR